jgi:hypothetical protein
MRKPVTSLALVAALIALSSIGAGTAAAQQHYGPGYYPQPPPPPTGIERGGVVLGGSVGLGGIFLGDCEDCEGLEGLALQFHIGGMVGPTVALMFDGSTVIHPFEDGGALLSNVGLGAIRVWVTPQLWISGGLGLGVLEFDDEYGYVDAHSETGLAGMVGAGVELLQTYNFALDLQLRATGARIDWGDGEGIYNVAVALGFNWY